MIRTANSPNITTNYWVTIVIPTFKRVDLLSHILTALKHQTYNDFNLIVVVKPSGDGTEELLRQESKQLKIKIILQAKGHLVDAYFIGVKQSTGQIVVFLDDDAIPAPNWLEEIVKLFSTSKIAAITGDSYPVLLENNQLQIIDEKEIPSVLSHFEFALFGRPLHGLENYKNAISKSGLVYERGNNAFSRNHGNVNALLRGPSMAIDGKILRSIDFKSDSILGCAWEMTLGWHIWKKGYRMVYSPDVKVYHIVHGRTSSRDFLKPRTDLLWAVEAELLFYRLYMNEPELSLISKIISDITRVAHSVKYLKSNISYYTRKLQGIFLGNIIGIKWIIYKKINSKYSPVIDLKRFQEEN